MSKDDFKKLIKLLGLGTKNQEKEAHDHQHSKRAVQPMKKVSDCFDSSELLAIFKDQNDNASLLLPEKFRELSPALIQQLLSSSCRKKADKPSQYKHYGYGILAVAVICFCSLLGVFMNICQKKVYGYTMAFFEGLAVGTLATDALLHLIPQVSNSLMLYSFLLRRVVVCCHRLVYKIHLNFRSLYDKVKALPRRKLQQLYTHTNARIQTHIHTITYHTYTNKHTHSIVYFVEYYFIEFVYAPFLTKILMNSPEAFHSEVYIFDLSLFLNQESQDTACTYGFYLLEVGFTVVTKESEHSHDLPKDTKLSEVYTTTNEKNNSLENPKSMAEPNIPEKPNKCSSLSLIVILGDALHNFADGLTIGAAFSTSESFGLMTSIAVLCHEIPHELGDFAVLLANGIGFKRALLFNFVSSLTAFVGLFIGLGVSTDFIVRRWIYAVSAGMFLYIAFVDLFPVMKKHKTVKSLVSLFSNAGLILGVIIITLLGFYEEKIVGH
ncbi:zinc transporter ZIP12 [Octopus bimaculoides]|nr:zinc transporter ZIP12 [Octopus bimaculoides]